MRLALAAMAVALIAIATPSVRGDPPIPTRVDGVQQITLLGSICHEAAPIAGPHRLVMLPGMGDDHMAADTVNPTAQRWFDYGLTLARSFEHDDAILAFQKAEAADPNCSLCVWGEAYARGPTINFGVGPVQTAAIFNLANKARALGRQSVNDAFSGLESALLDRYRSPDTASDDLAYAKDLDALNRGDPANVELAVFDAEAWLIVQRDNGELAPAQRAVAVLKPLIPLNPNNSGLVHFYIHATENAREPELALPYAERLAKLAPNASHMVHMPAHTLFRIGRYEAAALANVDALDVDRAYAERTDFPTPLGRMAYHFHDIQFGLAAAMLSGDGKIALWFVRQFNRDFPAPSTYDLRAAMAAGQTYAAFGRFAPTRVVLAAPDTVSMNPFLEAMRHYARGEAFVRERRAAAVRAQAAAIATLLDEPPQASLDSTSAVVARIAQLTLLGDADMLDNHPALAARSFSGAADLQDARLADDVDPPRWWYPVRRSLAEALLGEGDVVGAEREASRALASWKLDPITLMIRAAAKRRPRAGDAASDFAAARVGWRGRPAELSSTQLL